MAENIEQFVGNFFKERPFVKNGIRSKKDLKEVLFIKTKEKDTFETNLKTSTLHHKTDETK